MKVGWKGDLENRSGVDWSGVSEAWFTLTGFAYIQLLHPDRQTLPTVEAGSVCQALYL